jgi:hypothetical protein
VKSRHSRSDSVAEAVRVMKEAGRDLLPPPNVPLDAGDMPFFLNVLEELPTVDWSAHQLEIAALLARSMADFAVEQMMMRDEGAVVQGDKGLVPNPRKAVMNMHASNILAFRRTLALHAASRGETEHLAKRIAIGKTIEAQSPFKDELLARA